MFLETLIEGVKWTTAATGRILLLVTMSCICEYHKRNPDIQGRFPSSNEVPILYPLNPFRIRGIQSKITQPQSCVSNTSYFRATIDHSCNKFAPNSPASQEARSLSSCHPSIPYTSKKLFLLLVSSSSSSTYLLRADAYSSVTF